MMPACRTMSAKKDMAGLMRMMPLEVMMPMTQGLNLSLPVSDAGPADAAHDPFGGVVKIVGVAEDITVLSSLQKPKKVGSAVPRLFLRLEMPAWRVLAALDRQ